MQVKETVDGVEDGVEVIEAVGEADEVADGAVGEVCEATEVVDVAVGEV